MILGKYRSLLFYFLYTALNFLVHAADRIKTCTSTTPVYSNGVFPVSVVQREVVKEHGCSGWFQSAVRLVPGCASGLLLEPLSYCEFDLCSGWVLEWGDQHYTLSLRGSCINLKPYMFLNLKKHTLIIKKCKTGVCFPGGKPLSGKNINSESTKVHIILILFYVTVNLLASVVVGVFVSSLKC